MKSYFTEDEMNRLFEIRRSCNAEQLEVFTEWRDKLEEIRVSNGADTLIIFSDQPALEPGSIRQLIRWFKIVINPYSYNLFFKVSNKISSDNYYTQY